MSTPTTGLRLLARERRVRLTTYERDGTPLGSGTALAVDGDRAFVRTRRNARQAEHLRRYPEAELAPADWGGTPTGAPMKARVRLLHGDEARHAAARLAHKNPLQVLFSLSHMLRLGRAAYYELRLVGE